MYHIYAISDGKRVLNTNESLAAACCRAIAKMATAYDAWWEERGLSDQQLPANELAIASWMSDTGNAIPGIKFLPNITGPNGDRLVEVVKIQGLVHLAWIQVG